MTTTLNTAAALTLGTALSLQALAAAPAADPPRSRTVDVRHVAIDLRFDWQARQAEGSAALTLRPRVATRQVALDAGKLVIHSVQLADGTPLRFAYDGGDRDEGLAITLDREYQPQEDLTVRVAYRTGWVNHSDPANLWGSNGRGLRFMQPTSTDLRKRRQIWSSPEPGANRYWFPAIDAPDSVRSSELRATVDARLSVVANGTLVDQRVNADGTHTFHWRMDTPHASPHTAFVVGEYVDVRQQHGGVALHNFGYPDEAQAVADSVVLLPDMLRFFGELTGLPYPWPSYTQVFVQDFPWGGVGAGLATQTENMIDDYGTHADFLYLWDGLQAETLAHQWFGVQMGARDWGHAWLDRAFAKHLTGLYTEHQNGREEFLLWHLQADQATALADWAAGTRHPVATPQHPEAATFAADNVTYARGAAVLQMLRRELGDDTWRRVLREHVAAHRGQRITTDDFRRVVERVAGRPMGWFFEQWLYGIGHPVFEVHSQHDAAAGQLVLTLRQVQTRDQKSPFAQVPFFQGHLDIDIDGRIERVWLAPQAENRFVFRQPQPPQLLHVDHEGSWLKELRWAKTHDELLQQLRHSRNTTGRQWAMTELMRLAQAADAPATLRPALEAALRDVIASRSYWRLRFNALRQLRTLLAPRVATQPVALDPATRQLLLLVVRHERTWLRASALSVLGLSRDPAHAELYLQHLRDPSDRVINSAAIALGQSGSPQAFDALAALPAHPSWKNQSLISALAGLKELGDKRGAAVALKALADIRSPRWTLSTPVWDYRLAAAQTLAALGQGADAVPLLLTQVQQALADRDVNDILSHLLLLVTVGDERARSAFAPVRQHFQGQPEALAVVQQHETQLNDRLKPR